MPSRHGMLSAMPRWVCPECGRQFGRVRQGQLVNVTVDSFPDKQFGGQVTFIAQEAQFTPRNVQTKDERTTTVFAVRVELANPDHALKPGMPADATIVE